MKWVTRARPKTDRIACPWLIRRFIDPDAEILYVPDRPGPRPSPTTRTRTASTRPAPSSTTATGECTFEVLIDDFDLGDDPALVRLAAIVHAADIDDRARTPTRSARACSPSASAASTSRPTTTGCWSGPRSSTTPSTPGAPSRSRPRRHDRAPRLRRHPGRHRPPGRQAHGRRRHHRPQVRRPAVPRRASTSSSRPSSSTTPTPCTELADWLRARGKERREAIWFRDADVAEAIDAVLFVGLADWYPPNYDCGACGYATCAEFLHATKPLRDDSAELEFAGPDLQPARHRPRHRRRLRRQDRGHPLHRLPLPDPHRRRRPQARRHPRRRRRRPLPVAHPQGGRVRPPHRPTSTSTPSTYPPPAPSPSASTAPPAHGGARNRQQPRTPIRPTSTS